MKHLKVLTILFVFLIALSTSPLRAQGRDTRTSSAKAAYGYPAGEYKSKKKKKKQRKSPKRKTKAPQYRKKNPWVN